MAKKENKNNARHEIKIKIDGDDWKKEVDSAYSTVLATAQEDGFRKGHVPRSVYEKKHGSQRVYFDAANNVMDKAYRKAIDENKLVPVARPSVSISELDGDKVEFTFNIVTRPDVNIKKYKGLGIKPEDIEVTDEEVDDQINNLLEQYAELTTKDGKIENGDVAIIDFTGYMNGEEFDGGKGENYSLEIGSNSFIPGFEEGLIGLKAGDEKDLNLKFPESYGAEDLAGKDVLFKVKVNEVKEKKVPELDKDFFEDLGEDGVDSVDSLKDKVRDVIKTKKEAQAEDKYLDNLLEEVSKNVEVDIPQEMIDEEIEDSYQNLVNYLKSMGMGLDDYYKFSGRDEKSLREEMEHDAYHKILYHLMLDEIKNMENVVLNDEEFDKEVDSLATKYNTTKEDLIKEYNGIDNLRYSLEMRKVIELLKEYNK